MQKVFTFPHNKRTFQKFKNIYRMFLNNETFVVTLPSGENIVCFHYSGGEIPSEVMYELQFSNTYIFCCHPERLPQWAKQYHVFPNGKGICTMYVSEPFEKRAKMVLENK